MWGVIQPNSGEIEWREGVPNLDEMQEVVGGYIEPVDLRVDPGGRHLTIYVNDEGLLHQLTPNLYVAPTGQTLVGPAVVTCTDMSTGETVAVTEEERERIEFPVNMRLTPFGPLPAIDYKEGANA